MPREEDDLLRAEGDGSVGEDHVHQNAHRRASQHAQHGAAGDEAYQKAHQRADRGQALQSDVDQARPLGVQLRQRQKDQGRGHADAGEDDVHDKFHIRPPPSVSPSAFPGTP